MAEEVRSADFLVKTALETPGVMEQIKSNPEDTLRKLATQATQQPQFLGQDRWIYRLVVCFLGFIASSIAVGSICLSVRSSGQTIIPDILTAMGSAAIGALAGILAPSPLRK